MARGRRITVKLADLEIQSVRKFADENHVLLSVAVRWLLSAGFRNPQQAPRCPSNGSAFSTRSNWLTNETSPGRLR